MNGLNELKKTNKETNQDVNCPEPDGQISEDNVIMSNTNLMHKELMPFTEECLMKYFDGNNQLQQVIYFKYSIAKYKKYEEQKSMVKTKFKTYRQAEKDERFYTARTFVNIFEDENNRIDRLKEMLKIAFGDKPLFNNNKFKSWDEALGTKQKLILEHQLPAPKLFKKELSNNLEKHHFIPHIIEMGCDKKGFRKNLEGATHVDAYIYCEETKLRIIIEAKVLSDISYDVRYDIARNQIARNIDCMLEDREWENLFLLLTCKYFKDHPETRLYGYKMKDYQTNQFSIRNDLNHRNDLSDEEWRNLPNRIGWITWEDINKSLNCC